MKLAFCLYEYFAYGGLQRNCLMTGRVLAERGHDIHVFTRRWQGACPDGLRVTRIPTLAVTNIGCDSRYVHQVLRRLDAESWDCVVGFNRMPNLDAFYAADRCYALRHRGCSIFYRLTRRYRYRMAWERQIFAPQAKTEILLVREAEKEHFQAIYGTPDERFHVLLPNLERKRLFPELYPQARQAIRREFGIGAEDLMVLAVGSGFRTKGLDRTITALAALAPELRERTHLIVVGQDRSGRYEKQAEVAGLSNRVHFAQGRDNVPCFYCSADLLLHPARAENTGSVLLEALVMGLPIVTTDVCGFAHHVSDADAGHVLSSPFEQQALNHAMAELLADGARRKAMGRNGLGYGETADFYGRYDQVADIIEARAQRNRTTPT